MLYLSLADDSSAVYKHQLKPENKLKAQNLLFIILISLFFGLSYNYFFYPRTLTEFLEAGSIGIVLGLVIGILEVYVLANYFRTKSFRAVTAFRISVYSLIISITLALVLSIEVSMTEEYSYWEAFGRYLQRPNFRRDFLFTFLFIMFLLFSLEVVKLVGRKNFFRLLLGRYHQPREVSRVFMFVDLKDSTSIAERLLNKSYSAFIRDCFQDLSKAISLYGGEVYQYVGDEVVITWPLKTGPDRSIKCFFKMQEIIKDNYAFYLSEYGMFPQFKAGIHGGKVVITAIGKLKREIAYHGDVLNAAARIQGKCNELKQELLISEDMLKQMNVSSAYKMEEKGKIELKGKTRKLKLYGIHQRSTESTS